MNGFKVSFFKSKFASRPNSNTIDLLNTIIADKVESINRDNIKSFVKMIGDFGCAFCPATFVNGKKDIQNFEQQQLFVLDFNDGISFEEVKDRAKEYDLPILFAFEVFGGTNKFRVGFLNDVSIKHAKVAGIMVEALLTIFPEADPLSRDLTSIFLGGRKLLHFDESVQTLNIYSLLSSMCLYFYDRYGDKNYRRKIYGFSNLTGLELNENRMFDVSVVENSEEGSSISRVNELRDHETLSPYSILYIIENGDKSSSTGFKLSYRIRVNNRKNGDINNHSSPKKKKSEVHLPHRSTDLSTISSSCQLYREFENCIRRLTQTELAGIASNLIKVELGKTEFLRIIEEQSYFGDNIKRYSDWNFYLNYMKKTDCQPFSCNRFCPYRTQCQHSNDILSTAKPKYHTTQILANGKEQFYHINEAAADFKQKLDIAIKADDKRIHVINAPIAIGKSTAVLDLMEKNELLILIAFPNNDLKNEQYEKAIARGINAVKSPSLVESKNKLPEKVWKHIEYLYQIGKPHAVTQYIKDVIDKEEFDKPCLEILENYRKALSNFYASDCHAFTTHSRLLTLSRWDLKKYDAVIIDEDIILNCMIINQISIPISALIDVLDYIDSNSGLAKKITKAVEAAKTKSWVTLPRIKYDDAYDDISTAIDISSFCHAEKFYFKKKSDENNLLESSHLEDCIVFLKPLKLNHNVKYIMLSATVDQTICNYNFGAGRVQFYQCKKAKYMGILNQYTKDTMSRSCIDKNPGIIKKLIEPTGFKDIITFKKYGIGSIYFGKSTGIDYLRGKNLNVVGTPHQPEWIYKLFAYTMGIKFDEKATMSYQLVRHKVFQFHFMTFNKDNRVLRNIQFWMIESELEQAVGRARLLIEDCTVNLYMGMHLTNLGTIW